MRKYLIILLICSGLSACKKSDCENAPSISDVEVNVEIERLDQFLMTNKSKDKINQVIKNNPFLAEKYFNIKKYPHDSLFVNPYWNIISNKGLDTLYSQVQETFGDMKDIEAEFEEAFKYIKHYYPDFNPPKIKTIVSGFNAPELLVTDSLIVISLDYFIGPKAKYLPQSDGQLIPAYILKRFQKQYLVPMVVMLISNKYNQVNMLDKTLLAEMIYYGKAYYFTKQMLPCHSDTLITGYTKQETIDIAYYEDVIWASLVQNKALFKADQLLTQKICGESPKTYNIGDKCPGRIGRWVGWRILKSYQQANSNQTLNEIMDEKDAKKLFDASKYRPKGKEKADK